MQHQVPPLASTPKGCKPASAAAPTPTAAPGLLGKSLFENIEALVSNTQPASPNIGALIIRIGLWGA